MGNIETVAVIGLGYIGLPTAVAFALAGKKVIGVDINPEIVNAVNQGTPHIQEPQLAESLSQAVSFGQFFATEKIQPADAFIIAVPTPFKAEYQPDLSYIQQAVQNIAPVLTNGNLVILESTSPVGTTEQIAQWLKTARPDLSFPTDKQEQAEQPDIAIAYCPERVLPSRIMQELIENDRIIGGLDAYSAKQAVALYQSFAKGECIATDARTAEMCKLTENSFRDVNIAFANELSMICDELDINLWELTRLANRHPRVNILQAGAGVGGHCIAVDPWFIVAQAPTQARLIRMARLVNEQKPNWVIEKVKATVAECATAKNCKPSELTIACFGLAFKADVDDLRQSPALQITQTLADWHRGKVLVVEPYIQVLPENLQNKAELVDYAIALQQADIVVLLVDHQPFKTLKPTQTWIVDCKGIWQ
ncbi:UDP-N-acetyl-D-mannosamine dehydrogenase [Ursidibacter sp. B-7004-1]